MSIRLQDLNGSDAPTLLQEIEMEERAWGRNTREMRIREHQRRVAHNLKSIEDDPEFGIEESLVDMGIEVRIEDALGVKR